MEVRCGDQGLGVVGDGGWLTGSDKGAEEGEGGGGTRFKTYLICGSGIVGSHLVSSCQPCVMRACLPLKQAQHQEEDVPYSRTNQCRHTGWYTEQEPI